jgi:hypothetical protein
MMAEIVLKVGTVGPDPAWQDGDIIDCFNDRRIAQIHAEVICSYANPPRNSEGNGAPGTLADFMHTKVCTYRFDPISSTQATRTRLADGFQNTVTLREAHINKHTIAFGSQPNTYWYGGQQLFTAAALAAVWAEIEARTPFRKIDHGLAPLGNQDLKSHLAISVDDFTDVDRVTMTIPRFDGTRDNNMLKKREHRVAWRVLPLGVPVTEIEDRNRTKDIRKAATFNRTLVVSRKA